MNAKPNVIVFFTDQQRWDTLGLAGNPSGLTPNLDQYGRRGMYLAEATTCHPVCAPARSCLQTGQYASQTGVWRNGLAMQPDAVTLASAFRQGGYCTRYIGKWHLAGPSAPKGPVARDKRGDYECWLAANTLEMVSGPYSTTLWDEEDHPVHLPGYRVDALTDAAIRQLREARETDDRPQFLVLSHLEPHHQNTDDSYPAPRYTETLFQNAWVPPDLRALTGSSPGHWAGYCGMIKRLDEAFGRLMDAVHSLQFERDTVVCFISDHGCHFKTRNAEYKRSCHESSVRIPLIFMGGPFQGGGMHGEAASLVDVPPTLLDAAGLEIPAGMSGRSLVPLARNDKQGWPEESFIQFGDGSVRTGRCLRSSRWKYAVTIPEDMEPCAASSVYAETHLYDLQADPHELANLVGYASHASVRDTLRSRLRARMQAVGEPECDILKATEHASGQRTVEYPRDLSGRT